MIGKQFTTVSEWTEFMKDKYVIIIKPEHTNYKQRCRFVEMVARHNDIYHPSNQGGRMIKMKCKMINGEFVYLNPGEFFIEESVSIVRSFPKTGLNGMRRL